MSSVGSHDLRRIDRNADAGRDAKIVALELNGLGQRQADLRRQDARAGTVAQIHLQYGEFVATGARDEVGPAYAAPESLGNSLEQEIAKRMAERIIDVLETVEVDIENGEPQGAPLRRREGEPQPFDEGGPVGEAGESVGTSEKCNLFLGDPSFRNVDQHSLDLDQPSLGVAHRRIAIFNQTVGTAARQHALLQHAGLTVGLQRDRQRLADPGQVIWMDYVQE